jgi:transposase-like protein
MADADLVFRKACPKCGSPMRLALTPGGKGSRSYRCDECDRQDPFTAGTVSGWLQGELQPPK